MLLKNIYMIIILLDVNIKNKYKFMTNAKVNMT